MNSYSEAQESSKRADPERQESGLKLEHTPGNGGAQSGLKSNVSDPGCRSEELELTRLFSEGVKPERYTEFCRLLSKVMFNAPEDAGGGEGEGGVGVGGPDEDGEESECGGEELENEFWDSLEWFLSVLDDLNRYEALGFGAVFLANSLKRLTENGKGGEGGSRAEVEQAETSERLRRWIDFTNVFRDANNSIYTTYALLDMAENKLNHIRYKSIKILQLKHSNMSRFAGPSAPQQGGAGGSGDSCDSTPTSPSSTVTMSTDRGDRDALNEIWDEKLGQMHRHVFSSFRLYLVGIIRQLRALYPKHDYGELVQLVACRQPAQGPRSPEGAGDGGSCGSREGLSSGTRGEHLRSGCDDGGPGGRLEDLREGEDILDYLNRYYSARNMTDEKAENYVNRITDLNRRLVPKFVRVIARLPIYYEAYMNALVCSNVQDGLFQLLGPGANHRDAHRDRDMFREGREYREEALDQRDWTHKIELVRMLARTGLEVVEVARCSLGADRKLVVFTQGTLRDLFSNATYRDAYRDYKDSYRELFRDSVIRGDKEGGEEREDDEILNAIYYCDGNLAELAAQEVERLVQQHMPSFSWAPKLVKHQHAQPGRQGAPEYTESLDADAGLPEGAGPEFVEYVRLEERIWANRLGVFGRVNERSIRNLLACRNNNAVAPLRDDSSGLLCARSAPFKVLLDYNNYIPIKYIYNSGADEGRREEDNDWLIRLFNASSGRASKNSCIDVEIERDLFPGLYQFNNYKLNCFVMPVHRQGPERREAFVKFAKVLQNKIDLLYPPYLQQVARALQGAGGSPGAGAGAFGGEYGDFFVTYHTNLFIGNREKTAVNFVFHLVSCDTSMGDSVEPVEYADDTEVVLRQVQRMRPTLEGLARILEACNQLNVHTLHLPAALKCCYKISQYSGSAIQAEFHNTVTNYSYLSSQLNAQLPGGAQAKDVLECNADYVRCLAVVSYLASLLNKGRYSVRNLNLVFPQHLKQTLLPRTAASIFATRVNTF